MITTYRKSVSQGFVYLIPRDEIIVVALTQERKEEARRFLEEMREMIREERMPAPTSMRSRCAECEYRNYCGDIF